MLHWASLTLVALALLLILGPSFEMIQRGVNLADWSQDLDSIGIGAGIFILLFIIIVVLPLKWLARNRIPATERYKLYNRKVNLIFITLAALGIASAIVINWLY